MVEINTGGGAHVTQEGDGPNYYADQRYAVINMYAGRQVSVAELEADLKHFREYLEDAKIEWVSRKMEQRKITEIAAALHTMKVVRAKLEQCVNALMDKRLRPESLSRDVEWPSQAFDRLQKKVRAAHRKRLGIDLLANVSWWTRQSYWFNGRLVLVLKNKNDRPVKFGLRAFTRDDSSQHEFRRSLSAGESCNIGHEEGWNDNWVAGERFEIWSHDWSELAWRAEIS